jgi:rubrerythrin
LDFSRISLMDALDLASLIELEARERYTELAKSLGSRGVDDAGAVFRSMCINENKHYEEIAERRLALLGDQRARVKLDDNFDAEALATWTSRASRRRSRNCGKKRPSTSTCSRKSSRSCRRRLRSKSRTRITTRTGPQ